MSLPVRRILPRDAVYDHGIEQSIIREVENRLYERFGSTDFGPKILGVEPGYSTDQYTVAVRVAEQKDNVPVEVFAFCQDLCEEFLREGYDVSIYVRAPWSS
jgi:hypothetical protein